jgi:hypothetical protein
MPPPTPSLASRKRTRSTNITENHIDHQQTASSNSITTTATSVNITPLPPSSIPVNAPPKRQRNTPPAPPILPRTSYPLRNRSLTPNPRQSLTRFPSLHTPSSTSTNRQRYNLRPRRPQSQVRLPQVPTPHPIIAPRRIRRPIPPIAQTTTIIQPPALPIHPPPPPPALPPPAPPILPTPPFIQPRQYRLVYISDDDDGDPHARTQATATVVNTTFNLVTDDEEDELIRPQAARRRTSGTGGINTR